MIFASIRFLFRMWNGWCICKYTKYDFRIENRRSWIKRNSCMYHWMQTSYYKAKLKAQLTDQMSTEKENRDD